MIRLLQQPNKVSFSRNPVLFEFQTDNLYAATGRPYRSNMQFNEGKAEGSFTLSWKGVSQSFSFVSEADPDNALELPAYESGAVTDWLDSVLEKLKLNFYVESDFIVEKSNISLLFTSKRNTTDLNISYSSGMSGVSWSVYEYAHDKVIQKNFALYLEIYVEREDKTTFDRYSQSTIEVDLEGKAIWDLQRYLTAILLKEGPILPDLKDSSVIVDNRSVRQYYIRYAEMYGDPQRIGRVYQTENFTAVLGGFADDYLHRVLPDYFRGPFGELEWLTGIAIQNLHVSQPGFASIVNFNKTYTDVTLKCRLFFANKLEEEFVLSEHPEWQRNSKLVVPIGFMNKLSFFTDRRNITYAMLWVESAGERVSNNLEISFNNDILPALMPILYLNAYGCFQTLYTYGARTFVYDIDKTSEAFAATLRRTAMLHSLQEMGIKIRDGIKVNSGFFPRYVIKRFRDFMLSTYKYIYLENRWRPVVLDSNSIEESEDFENLQAIGFTVLFSNEQFVWGN